MDSAGRERFTTQCRICGNIDHELLNKNGFSLWIPRAQVPGGGENIEEWDESLRIKWRQKWLDESTRAQEARIESHRRELEERKREWWKQYDEFLRSPKWMEKRDIVIKRDGVCQACLKRPVQHVHHTTYKYGVDAPLFTLVGVCRTCHQALHPDRELA